MTRRDRHPPRQPPSNIRLIARSRIFDDLILLARGEICVEELDAETVSFVETLCDSIDTGLDVLLAVANERAEQAELASVAEARGRQCVEGMQERALRPPSGPPALRIVRSEHAVEADRTPSPAPERP